MRRHASTTAWDWRTEVRVYEEVDLLTKEESRAVIYKLIFFTAAMVGGPIGTYYLCLRTIAGGSCFDVSCHLLPPPSPLSPPHPLFLSLPLPPTPPRPSLSHNPHTIPHPPPLPPISSPLLSLSPFPLLPKAHTNPSPLTTHRLLHLRGRHGGDNGQRRPGRVRDRRDAGRSERALGGGGEGAEGGVSRSGGRGE